MKCLIKFSVISILLIFGMSVFGWSQPSSSGQEEKPLPVPGRTPVARTDTVRSEPENKEKKLPTLQLKNYVIKGKEEITLPTPEKTSTGPQRELQRAMNSEVDEHRAARVLTSDPGKPIRSFETPAGSRRSSLQAGYGKYNDISIIAQAAKTHQSHDVIAKMDFHSTSGFIDNAEETQAKLRVGDAYKLHNRVQGKLNVGYAYQGYKFYGAQDDLRNMKRKIHGIDGDARIDIHAGRKAAIGLMGGGMVGKIDDGVKGGVPANSLWGDVMARAFVGSYMITASLEAKKYSYEPNIGTTDIPENEKRSLRSVKARIGFEGTVRQGLHIRVGGALFNTEDAVNDRISRFYPYASVSKTLPEIGEVFAAFTPEITSRSILEGIQINRFLDASSLVSYTDYPISLRAGLRKRTSEGVTLEVAYIYKKVEHLDVEIDFEQDGMWQLNYNLNNMGNKTYLQGLQAVTDWQVSDQFSLWGAVSVLDYSKLDGITGGNVPYHSNVTGSGMAQFRPGHGIRVELTGKYVGSRFGDIWGNKELDPYVLVNFHIGKQFVRKFEIGISVYNIFNQKFEIRDMYRQPDMVSAGVIKMYW